MISQTQDSLQSSKQPTQKRVNIVKFPKTLVENGKRYNNQFQILKEKKEVHSADPIRNAADIDRIVLYLLRSQKWRDAMLFILGCNTAFRISDLLRYRVCDIVGLDNQERLSFVPQEKKTGHFRKIYYNQAIHAMMALYLKMDKSLQPSSFLFYNQSRNARWCRMDDGSEVYEAMTRQAADRVIKATMEQFDTPGHYSTHSWRQTFTYHFECMMFEDSENLNIPLTIQALQMILGHSSITSTFHYSNRAEEEIARLYNNMNLGLTAIKLFNAERSNHTTYGGTNIGSIGSDYCN